jgi:hypothetical protein
MPRTEYFLRSLPPIGRCLNQVDAKRRLTPKAGLRQRLSISFLFNRKFWGVSADRGDNGGAKRRLGAPSMRRYPSVGTLLASFRRLTPWPAGHWAVGTCALDGKLGASAVSFYRCARLAPPVTTRVVSFSKGINASWQQTRASFSQTVAWPRVQICRRAIVACVFICQQPPHIRSGIQFAGHHDFSLCRFDFDSGIHRHSRSDDVVGWCVNRFPLCIFLYVGAEVAIGSVIVSYLMQGNVLGLGAAFGGSV